MLGPSAAASGSEILVRNPQVQQVASCCTLDGEVVPRTLVEATRVPLHPPYPSRPQPTNDSVDHSADDLLLTLPVRQGADGTWLEQVRVLEQPALKRFSERRRPVVKLGDGDLDHVFPEMQE